MSRRVLLLFGLTVLAAILSVVPGVPPRPAAAAPVVGSGSISLTNLGDTQSIYTNSEPRAAGISVSVSAGELEVESWNGQEWEDLGTVGSGMTGVFEGGYTQIQVRAIVPGTAGSYENRRPTDQHSTDHTIGQGSVTLTGGPVRVYATSSSAQRHLFVEAGSAPVSVRASGSGSDIVSVDAGDSAYVSRSVTEYWLVGTGTVTFSVLDAFAVESGDDSKEGEVASSGKDDKDRVFTGDGSQCFKVTVTNTGAGKIFVTAKYKAEGSARSPIEVDRNESTTITCMLEYVDISYEMAASGKAKYKTEAVTNP